MLFYTSELFKVYRGDQLQNLLYNRPLIHQHGCTQRIDGRDTPSSRAIRTAAAVERL